MIIELRYTLVFYKIDGKSCGFFPDLPEIGKFFADDSDQLISLADYKVRAYCIKHINKLPPASKYHDLYMKYVRELNYNIITICQGIDEYHDSEKSLIDYVCDEFKNQLNLNNISLLEDYIERYYKKSSLDSPEFNLLVFEYYALCKKDFKMAHEAFDYYMNGTFPHNALPKMELIDWLIANDGDLDALCILKYIDDEISKNKSSKLFGNNKLKKDVEKRLIPLLKKYPKFDVNN